MMRAASSGSVRGSGKPPRRAYKGPSAGSSHRVAGHRVAGTGRSLNAFWNIDAQRITAVSPAEPTPRSSPALHPEFGYLWPTPQFRRIMRVALWASVLGATFGAVGVFAFGSRQEPEKATVEKARVEPVLAINQIDVAAAEPARAPLSTIDTTSSIVGTTSPPQAEAAKPCAEQAWPYLDKKCFTSTSRKRRHVRVIVQNAPAPVEAAPAPVANAAADRAKAAPSAEPPKVRKTAQKSPQSPRKRSQERERDREEADAQNAYATRTPSRSRREYSYEPRREYSYEPREEYSYRLRPDFPPGPPPPIEHPREWGGWSW